LLAPAASLAQPAPPPMRDLKIDAATRAKVIDSALASLHKLYVFPDVAKQIETEIRKHVAAKKYDSITSGIAFAEVLTQDLQAISRDKHMRMRFSPDPIPDRKPDGPSTPAEMTRFRQQMKLWNAGVQKVERLDGNVGYVRLDLFMPPADSAGKIAAAMTFVADTDALIFDLRWNLGGDPATVSLLVSYLYDADDEVHVNDIYSRPDNSTRQLWTAPEVSGRRFPKKPVYVLTSKRTFSGGEEFAYDIQNLKRGTLVGETTGGGAHPGGPEKVHTNFALNIPRGRAINPITKTNWEGVGVKPGVEVPADKALDVAYLAALEKQRTAVDAKQWPALAKEIEDAIAKLKAAK
jgi:C-terminal processing protease CtpA/Prc